LRSRNKRKRSAYRTGDRLKAFLRRSGIFLLSLATISLLIYILIVSVDLLTIRDIDISGNQNLSKREVLKGSGLHEGENLLTLSLEDAERWLRENPWIREVSIRKQFPDTLLIIIKESTPVALLNHHGRVFLVDERGSILQELDDKSYRFLPLINVDSLNDRRGITESLKLVRALQESRISGRGESIEIGIEKYGLSLRIDGDLLKVGYDDYLEKLKRWSALEPELQRIGLKREYVDLRFKDLIIKPVVKDEKEDEKGRVNSNS